MYSFLSNQYHRVLFLDELGEFSKKTLDILRQPLMQIKKPTTNFLW
nr:ATP-binding protein [Bacillus weihaiensis]